MGCCLMDLLVVVIASADRDADRYFVKNVHGTTMRGVGISVFSCHFWRDNGYNPLIAG